MKIKETYSHLGGSEILEVKYPEISKEIDIVISRIEAKKTKISKEKNKIGRKYYDPKELNKDFKVEFAKFGYTEAFLSFKTQLKYPTQGKGKQIDYSKDRVFIEVQFGKYSFMFYDMSKFQQAYNENLIDVGIEIVATRDMTKEMSSGVSYGEQLINDITALRRHYPSAPVKIIMIEP